ncbi:MAG TPA: phenylalanine--tRNA ligase subunit beta [Acidobacteriaceae bacterium]|nr:phenylalanine--tRNA ligase subunit beta [Acidobacteriaceae bacterium]
MNILTAWLRHYLPQLSVSDRQLADDLTLRGIAVEGVHDLGVGAGGAHNGHLFEMDITTNRVDAMNHYGIAREAATIYNLPLAPLDGALSVRGVVAKAFSVEIEAREVCGRFTAQVLRDVTIGPSTGQVAEYFALLGAKPIWNAVDASNFVLQGMGHPTHAFDLDKIEGGIVVRLARKGERLKLLDGIERTLEVDDLVVADDVKPLGLAGVMGGWDSMITAETKNVLVEAAWFDPASVRRSARRHGLHTDASHRFERGADFNACATANGLVAKLILESGGQAEGELIDIVVAEIAARTANRRPIALSVAEVQRHLGATLDDRDGNSALSGELIAQYLTALGCELRPQGPESGVRETVFSAKLPSWRLDLEREIDLIEEVARVYGYNRFANTLPTALPMKAHPLAAAEAAVRTRLLTLGYSEAISSSFASDVDGARFGAKGCGVVALENPLSEEARLLRPSLIPGMIAMLAHNLNRDVRDARLFEQGAVFGGSTEAVVESHSLVIGLTGEVGATRLSSAKDAAFFELKGVVESLLSMFGSSGGSLAKSAAEQATFSTDAPSWIEPGRGAFVTLDGARIACFGELAFGERDMRKLRHGIYLCEINLEALYELPLRRAVAREISRFQAVERDFSFTFTDSVQWRNVAEAIEGLAIRELTRLEPVEIFRDAKGVSVPAGHHALLLRCVFQSLERTLREDELTDWWSKIIAALTALGGTIRA